MIFGYAMTQCVKFYKEHSPLSLEQRNSRKNDPFNKQANQARLDMVDRILYAAYVDDLLCHEFFSSLVVYFIHIYSFDKRVHYIQTNFPSFKNPKKMIQSESQFVQEISTLSTTDFDSFLKHFSQFLNLQISKEIKRECLAVYFITSTILPTL